MSEILLATPEPPRYNILHGHRLAPRPKIVQLAERIAADIRRRRLQPGDSYLNTAGTAKMLGVSTTSANSAMQLLVQRNILERRQRKGTVIAEPKAPGRAAGLRRVNLLVHQRFLHTEGLLADGMLIGIQSALPEADLQLNFMPPGEELPFVRRRIAEALAAPEPEGFVLIRASVEVQRALAECGLPAVLSGIPFPSVNGLSWIDRDQPAMGRVLVEHLLSQGARWLLVLMRERMLQGDHQLFDGVCAALASAGLPADAVTLRCVPDDPGYVAAEVETALATRRGKGGILCRNTPLADQAAAVAPRTPVVVCDVYGPKTSYPFPRPQVTQHERGAWIGRTLNNLARGQKAPPDHLLIPVQMETPT